MILNLFGDKVTQVVRDGSSDLSSVGGDNCAIGVRHKVASGIGSDGGNGSNSMARTEPNWVESYAQREVK